MMIRLIPVVFMLLGLCSCQQHFSNTQMQDNKHMCQSTCVKKHELCRQNCTDNCKQCQIEAWQEKTVKLKKYHTERIIMGGLMDRDLNSYRDPLQCRKVTCNCAADYQVCQQSCTGKIHKTLQAEPTCG